MYLFERFVLKGDGVTSISMTSVAGLSVSIPSIMAKINPDLEIYREGATAAIAFAVVLTSIITPILVKKIWEKISFKISNHPGPSPGWFFLDK